MIFIFFHLLGLMFLIWYYKLKIRLVNLAFVIGIFAVYYFTLQDTSFVAVLIYSWAVYFLNTYILFRNVHVSYHVSITVIIVGLFANALIVQDAFYFYQYMFEASLVNVLVMVVHLLVMIGVLFVRTRLSFFRKALYVSRFTYINLFVHAQIVMIHLLKDFNIMRIYALGVDGYYYQSIFYTIFVFYLVLIVSAVFDENKRAVEQALMAELTLKQEELYYLFETRPSKLIQQMKKHASNGDYEELLKETSKYMGFRKKVAHKRVLDKLNDDLLAYVTMEVISREKDVAFEVVVQCGAETTLSKRYYFLEMYGIVLDNAVAAAMKANLRYVKIVFEKDKVIVENSFVKEDVNQLMEKNSLKGKTKRINGLKLLDYLEQESNINVNVVVSYRVIVSLEVEYA